MAITSKNGVCNLGVSLLGNYGTVSDIDTPVEDIERSCALWYDICRQHVLKHLMPNFALTRLIVAKLSETPAFGYSYFYEYPATALKVLGVGEVEDRMDDYNIERTPLGVKAISHDTDYTAGMKIRIIRDIEDINEWSPESKLLLAQYIAAYTCQSITQDAQKAAQLKAALPMEISSASGLNAQENRPVRISRSRFNNSRYNDSPSNTDKR